MRSEWIVIVGKAIGKRCLFLYPLTPELNQKRTNGNYRLLNAPASPACNPPLP